MDAVSMVAARDGTRLHVQDWGTGRPILFVAAWALDSGFWGSAMVAMVKAGFRCVAYDRRGHGRSDAPSVGYDSDTLADDLATVVSARDLRDAVIVAHSMGAGEAVRCLARHGSGRVARLCLVGPTTPYIPRADNNPGGVPDALIDAGLAEIAEDIPGWVAANDAPFFTPETGAETRAWIKAMMLRTPRRGAGVPRHGGAHGPSARPRRHRSADAGAARRP
jgi:pimeloyl-ACP methyl ester carboxylesterase